MQADTKKRIGIIRGGTGEHYASSLRRGGEIISSFFENSGGKFKAVDILIDKNGVWYINGVPIKPTDLMHKIDAVWNTSLHPGLSATLDSLSIPNIGGEFFLRILENNADILKTHVESIGIKMPRSLLLPVYQKDFDGPRERYAIKKAKEIHEKFPAPWIVKSFSPDSNMGIHLAKTFRELVSGIEDGVAHGKSILVEEFISGKVDSVHSLSGFRGENVYVFPPANFKIDEKEELISIVRNLHGHLGTKHYLQSNFVLHPKKGFFLTGINFSPDLRKGSHFEQSCQYVGAEIHHIIGHILESTL